MQAPALPLFGGAEPATRAPLTERPTLHVVVHGTPEPAGSKRSFVPKGWTRPVVVDANPKAKGWKGLVAQHAGEAMEGRALLRGPLHLTLQFTVRRPKGHYGARGLKPGAPAHPTTRPDVLKLARGVEDALSGVVYADDSQVVDERLRKVFGETEGVEIVVVELRP